MSDLSLYGFPDTETSAKLISRSSFAGGCLLWNGYVNEHGYGRITYQGENKATHRLAYEEAVGPITGDDVVDHLCGNRRCLLPAHLEAVSNKENVRRGPCSVLCEADISDILWLRNVKELTIADIARRYGMSESGISWYLDDKHHHRSVRDTELWSLECDERHRILERLWSKCRRGVGSDSDSCLLWTGGLTAGGYGRVKLKCTSYMAHRAVMELGSGKKIPEGMHVGHMCANRRCVELSHLEVITPSENASEKSFRGSIALPTHSIQS